MRVVIPFIACVMSVVAIAHQAPVGNDPSEPFFPTEYAQCDQLASQWSLRKDELYQQVRACSDREYRACDGLPLTQQSACLSGRTNPRWRNGPVSGCNQVQALYNGCQAITNTWHCAIDEAGPSVERCKAAVAAADDRIRRVNQALSSVGASSSDLLARATVGQLIRDAVGSSQLMKDLGRVSALAHSTERIQAALKALQASGSSDAAASLRHTVDILQELGRRGFSKSPLALLLTDIALQYVGTVQGDALSALDSQFRLFTQRLENRPTPTTPVVQAPGTPPECALLKDEQKNRALMQSDPERWLALVQRCSKVP